MNLEEDNNELKEFWEISAESVNDSIRSKTLKENPYGYYFRNLKKLETVLFSNSITKRMIVQRNVVFDFFVNIELDSAYEEETLVSCFIDNFNSFYGSIELKIIVPKGSPFFSYDNTIILPSGTYILRKKKEKSYVVELIIPKKIIL